MKIIATDNLNRESVADRLVLGNIPNMSVEHRLKAEEFVDWANSLNHCDDLGGPWYQLVEDDYRLSRGMADLI